MKNSFGDKLKKLREVRGVSQTELARRLGYGTNSYIYDIEKGLFVPPEEKLRQIARALDVPFDLIKDLALEARLEGLGIREPGFVSLLKDYSRLSKEDRKAIIRTYLDVKAARARQGHGTHH